MEDFKETLSQRAEALTAELIKALAEYGEKNGLQRDDSYTVACQAVFGSARLILQSGEHPESLVDKVCSPGGTTVEGLLRLKKNGFDKCVIESLE